MFLLSPRKFQQISLHGVLIHVDLQKQLNACASRCKMASNWQRVKEEVTCAICQDLLNQPKVFPCLHSFCTGCLKEWSEKLANLDPSKRYLECPLCRSKVLLLTSQAVEELPSHFSAIRLVETVRLQEQVSSKKVTPICQNCEEDDAVSSCSECATFLCEICEKSHKRTKTTKEHKICSLDEMRKGNSGIASVLPKKVEMCPTHPTKPLELYCKCKEMFICRDCTIKKHKDHDYDVISDIIEGEKEILREALPGIQQSIDEVENAVTRVQGKRKDMKNKEEEILHHLEESFNALHAALDNRKQQLRENVTNDSKERDKDLQVQENELCFLLSQLKSCHSFIDDKVRQGVEQDVLTIKRSMLERRDELTNLKEQTKMYPVVQKPFLANFKQMDKLMKMIPKLE